MIRLPDRARRAAWWARRGFSPGALILLYHRVIDLPTDPYVLCVSPRHFAEHLEVLRKSARTLGLVDLDLARREGRLPRRAVAVTIDDGYADSQTLIHPMLEHYDVPATVFVASGHVGTQREFWWDAIERPLLSPGRLPEHLDRSIAGLEYRLNGAARYDAESFERHRHWNLGHDDDPTPRHQLFRSLYQHLQPLAAEDREKVIDRLLNWAGASPDARPTHRSLSANEVLALVRGGLVEVGAHTVTHPSLSTLAAAAQEDEIRRSKADLEAIVNRPVTSFSYPHGRYADATVTAAGKAGFDRACTTAHQVAWRGNDCFRLPRFRVLDWDGDTFARQLEEWFHG